MFPRSSGDWGGIFVHEQALALRKAGVDARVITGDPTLVTPSSFRKKEIYRHFVPARIPEWRNIAGVPTLYFRYLTVYSPWWGYVGARSYRREVKRLAIKIREVFPFDIVHAHTAFLDGNAGAWLACHFTVPLVITEHTGPFSALTEQATMRRQTQRALNEADVLVSVSSALKQDILTQVKIRNPERLQVVGNVVDTRLFRPNGEQPPRDGTIRALWVGGFVPVKQPFMLIDAFTSAFAREPRLKLSMVGDGVLERVIREYIKKCDVGRAVSLHPSASRQVIADYMRRHHFLVISSKTETFGLVAVEALACGRPVLSTRCGGPEETIEDERYGILVENSVDSLADGLLAMASRIAEFEPMALNQYARHNYGYDIIAARLKMLYAKALDRVAANAN